jgi:hypothetical protein
MAAIWVRRLFFMMSRSFEVEREGGREDVCHGGG